MQVVFALLLLVAAAFAAEFPFKLEEATQAELRNKYDYIVVGGGATGCALATTLSEKYRVLLLERGGSPYDNPLLMRVENFFLGLLDPAAQSFVSTDNVANARGRVLGGGSSINAGFWDRAPAEELKMIGFDPVKVNESYTWAENVIVSLPRTGPFQSAFHAGLVEAGVTPDLGATYEHSVGTKTGGSLFDQHGQRRPSSNLIAAYANRDNLQVLLHATVTKIIFDEKKKAHIAGVKFTDADGNEHEAFLSKNEHSEVILSASAIGTPHLLMMSGIGPADHLNSKNISVVLNLPVGKNIADNPATRVFVPSPSPVESALVQVAGITAFGSYIEALSGVQSLQGSVIFQKVAGPKSTGEVLIDTPNIADNPIITFNYYQELQDLLSCIGGLNVIEELLLSRSMVPYVYGMQGMPSGNVLGLPVRRFFPKEEVDLVLGAYCKVNVGTMWHYHGSCRVGQVVDAKYKVIGAERLRVVDGSVFDFCPGTNPQATFIMTGRYMGLDIMADRANANANASASPKPRPSV